MSKVSIIVPAYNVEKYVAICIESIIYQTYKDLEIIIVDDGSSDSTGVICDSYAERDSRISVIHTNNGGVSKARNMAIDRVTGEYITFVDSDDYIASSMIERMLAEILANEADIVICNYDKVTSDGKLLSKNVQVTDRVTTSYEILKSINSSYGWSYIIPMCKLIKRGVVSSIRFPEGMIHEDEAIAHLLYTNASKVVCISDALYCYRDTPGSIMENKLSIRHTDGMTAIYNRFCFYRDNGYKDLLRGTLECSKYTLSKINHYSVCSKDDQEKIKLMKRMFRTMVAELGHDAGFINRIISFNPELYYFLRSLLRKEK